MDLVVDANVFFAALIRRGITADLFFKDQLHLYAPEFLFEEFEKYKQVLLEKTERTKEEFDSLMQVFQRRIHIIPMEEIDPLLPKAKAISPDVKDVVYIALALRLHCAIWSNDKALKEKQNVVRVYNTADLLNMYITKHL